MKPWLFDIMKEIIGDAKCKFIGEIGTHHGATAYQLVTHFAPRVDHLTYHGYDVFDQVRGDTEFSMKERNGKGAGSIERAKQNFRKAMSKHKNISYELFQGFTTDTLVNPVVFDFVYIDGGHSYKTVKHDYSMVKDSKIIVFDDFKIAGVNKFIQELKESGIEVQIVTTPSKHTWAVIRN
jgi:hypothetical protein